MLNSVGMNVPCGKCMFCLSTKRAQWSLRIAQEYRHCTAAQFVTLTYEDTQLPMAECGLPELNKKDFQDFMKRLRKMSQGKLRYYAVGEYGEILERPHYHIILFNLSPRKLDALCNAWQKGHVHIGKVEPASIHYVTKYVINKEVEYIGREPPFSLMSRKPGIGYQYLQTHAKWHAEDLRNYMKINGQTTVLPRYYKEKLYSQTERETMAAIAELMSDQQYHETIQQLSKFHEDPYHYHDERIVHLHNKPLTKNGTF